MGMLFFAAPKPPKVRPVNPWVGVEMTWTGTDGSSWSLTDWRSGVQLLGGVRGLGRVEPERHTSQSSIVHGSRNRGYRFPERDVFWPVSVCQMEGTQAWLEYDAAFWASMNPRGTGVWRVTQPNGQWRELTCRPVGDGDHEWVKAPGLRYWTNYGVSLVAEDPFWYGPEVTSPLWTSAEPVDFIQATGEATSYAWSGTPGASTSTKSVGGSVVAHNYNPAGAFGNGTGGYSIGSIDTAIYRTGRSLRVDPNATRPIGHNGIVLDVSTYAGSTIRAQAWVRTAAGATTGAQLRLVGGAAATSSETAVTDGEWQLLTLDVDVLATGNMYMYMYGDETAQVWYDSVRLGEPDEHGIFDGDTPGEIAGGGPPYHPGKATTIDSASLTNPGDEVAWPRWTVVGPVDSVSVSVDGHTVGYGELIQGETLVIDTDPRVQRAFKNGADVTGSLTSYDFAPIPAGATVPLDIVMTGGGTLQASFRPRFDRAY